MSKSLRRALAVDPNRVNAGVPLIVDTTDLVTPQSAQEMLKRNTSNRPVNWNKVEEYSDIMLNGGWKLHGQGIMLDANGNPLNGQNRLWAVVYSGVSVYMRISRGNPPDTARVIDRGVPQSARDLATRETTVKHSPLEVAVARGVCMLRGIPKPSKDTLADTIVRLAPMAQPLLRDLAGTKKTRAVLMIVAAICTQDWPAADARRRLRDVDDLAWQLDRALLPQTAAQCWGRGAAFGLAMEHARRIIMGPAPVQS